MANLADHITFENIDDLSTLLTNQVKIVAHLHITSEMVMDKAVYEHVMYDLNKFVYPELKERTIDYVKSFDDIKGK